MTTQITDRIEYAEREWSVEGRSGLGMFRRQDHGIETNMRLTACWRGYFANYIVSEADKVLRLSRVSVLFDADEPAVKVPPLFGVAIRTDKKGDWSYYENLTELVNFSGGLLVGRDYHKEWSNAFPALDFATVHELLFQEGVLQMAVDRSHEFGGLRELVYRQTNVIDLPEDADAEAWLTTVGRHIHEAKAWMHDKLFFTDYDHAYFE